MAFTGINKLKELPTKVKIIMASVVFAVIAAVVIIILLSTRGYYAKTMRLLRVEGIVRVESADGEERSITENMRFQSGEAISTGAASLASIGLDDHKVVTLQENSRAEFRKQGKQLELMLTAGGVFFEVDKPLENDESFDIRTSTMIVGIRGTSGYVFVDEEGHECLMLTDGHVHIRGTNPVTGEQKEIDLSAGNMVRVYLYNDREVDSIMFHEEKVGEEAIPDFAREMILGDADLLAVVCADAGWDPAIIQGIQDGTWVIEPVDDLAEDTVTPSPSSTSTPTPTRRPGATATATPTSTQTPGRPGGNGDPSSTPTSVPTITPADGNTDSPSATPSDTPTPESTRMIKPTAAPSITPTPSVSPTPSTVPTITPIVTATPTGEPTNTPTSVPTSVPTGEPSITTTPTDEPTAAPTDEPTAAPTSEPTSEPTTVPTVEPTSEPTEEPTPDPTEEPTPEPTEEPTPEPTEEPTPEPTEEPTPEPTVEPTPEPTPAYTGGFLRGGITGPTYEYVIENGDDEEYVYLRSTTDREGNTCYYEEENDVYYYYDAEDRSLYVVPPELCPEGSLYPLVPVPEDYPYDCTDDGRVVWGMAYSDEETGEAYGVYILTDNRGTYYAYREGYWTEVFKTTSGNYTVYYYANQEIYYRAVNY